MNEISVRLARANNSQTSFNFKLGHTRPTGLNARLPFRSITMRGLSHSGSKRKDCFSYVLGKHSLSMRAFILFYMQTRRCELQEIKLRPPQLQWRHHWPRFHLWNFFGDLLLQFFFPSVTINQVKFVMKPITNVTHYYILHIFNYKLREMLGLLFILFHSFDIQFYGIIFFSFLRITSHVIFWKYLNFVFLHQKKNGINENTWNKINVSDKNVTTLPSQGLKSSKIITKEVQYISRTPNCTSTVRNK